MLRTESHKHIACQSVPGRPKDYGERFEKNGRERDHHRIGNKKQQGKPGMDWIAMTMRKRRLVVFISIWFDKLPP